MAASYEAHIRAVLRDAGVKVVTRGTPRDGTVIITWGGSATVDDSQTQGTFTVTVFQAGSRDVSVLLGKIWRALRADADMIPLYVRSDEVLPVGGDGFVEVSTIVCDTNAAWWDEDEVAALSG